MKSEHPETSHTPLSWLWGEIEQRFGSVVASELYEGYLVELRQYQAEHRKRRASKRERKQQDEVSNVPVFRDEI